MNTNTISFNELDKFNDSNSAVLLGIEFEEGDDFSKLKDFLTNELGFSNGKNLIGVHRITGNVLGDEGRRDWLLEFDNEDVQFNPLARLRCARSLKWTSDFIDNYREDYDADASEEELEDDYEYQLDEDQQEIYRLIQEGMDGNEQAKQQLVEDYNIHWDEE